MRVGVVLDLAALPLDEVAETAAAVESAGVDLLWLRPTADRPYEALPAAASCAAMLCATQIIAEVLVGGSHPIYLAEERNVVDQILGGRLTVALRSLRSSRTELSEWVAVLLQAARTAPFNYNGPRFRIPAGLEANTVNREDRVVVTPPPLSLDPQVWVTGPGAVDSAGEFGISFVEEDADPAAAWTSVTERLGAAALRLRRPAVRSWSPSAEDATAVAARLVAERDAWGLDCALVHLDVSPTSPAWAQALSDLQSVVRPRVQTHRLPAGLEDFWTRERRVAPPVGAAATTKPRLSFGEPSMSERQ